MHNTVNIASAKDSKSLINDKNININPKSQLFLKCHKSYSDNILPKQQLIDNIKCKSNYITNFNWERFFYKFTNKLQSLSAFCIQGKDGAYRIAQLYLVKKLQFLLLIMMYTDYQLLKIYININNKDRLRNRLVTKNILGDT